MIIIHVTGFCVGVAPLLITPSFPIRMFIEYDNRPVNILKGCGIVLPDIKYDYNVNDQHIN